MAEFQAGVSRFIFARYRADRPGLFELKDGEAERYRIFANTGLICPVDGCPSPKITTVNRSRYQDGFKHYRSAFSHGPESLFHVEGKAVIARWARETYPEAEVVEEQASNRERERIADVMVTFVDGRRVALEVQYASLTPTDWQERHDSYRAQGILDIWLFGHYGNQMPAADDVGKITLNPTHERAAEHGSPVLWFNPTIRQVAHLRAVERVDAMSFSTLPLTGAGRMEAESLDAFTLDPARGLWSPELRKLAVSTAAFLTAEKEEMARQEKIEASKRYWLAHNLGKREALAAVWPQTRDGKVILARYGGTVPAFLDVPVSVDIPIPNTMWQSHLLLTLVDQTGPGLSVQQPGIEKRLIEEFGLGIPIPAASLIITEWFSALARHKILLARRIRKQWTMEMDYKTLMPPPHPTPVRRMPGRTIVEPFAERLLRENAYSDRVRAAKEEHRNKPQQGQGRRANCSACGHALDPLMGTVSDYHLTCDPGWKDQRPHTGLR